MKQNQILLTKLSEERQKEDDREKAINNAKDASERSQLETQFGIERAQASTRIVRYNE
jgi:predicted  nucleic acid-binding Zn-ribbon protein